MKKYKHRFNKIPILMLGVNFAKFILLKSKMVEFRDCRRTWHIWNFLSIKE